MATAACEGAAQAHESLKDMNVTKDVRYHPRTLCTFCKGSMYHVACRRSSQNSKPRFKSQSSWSCFLSTSRRFQTQRSVRIMCRSRGRNLTTAAVQAREENDAYIRQLELEGRVEEVYGKGVNMVTPAAEFVLKTVDVQSKAKVFINVCSSTKVAAARKHQHHGPESAPHPTSNAGGGHDNDANHRP
jgi:hypothetical protein